MMLDCPCGHPRPYDECCGALHRGERTAPTAEALMRSRYAAFARGEVDYLVDTLHASKRSALERRELEASVKRLRWVGLRILDTARGGPADPDGVVEFEARYEAPGDAGVLHERSRFVREGDRWYYLDGEFPGAARGAKAPGRNEPCPCGSGKKFKRCCAAR